MQFPAIEAAIRQAIIAYEPRIDPKTLGVQIVREGFSIQHNSLRLVIRGHLWNQPVPLELLLSADVDVETGLAAVRDPAQLIERAWIHGFSATTTRSFATCGRWAASSRASFRRSPGRLGMESMEVADPVCRAADRGLCIPRGAGATQAGRGISAALAAPARDGLPELVGSGAVDARGAAQAVERSQPHQRLSSAKGQRADRPANPAQQHALRISHDAGGHADACEGGRPRSTFLEPAICRCPGLPLHERPKSGVRVRFELPAGFAFSALKVGSLRLYLGGLPDVAMRLHELIVGATVGMMAGAPGRGADAGRVFLAADQVRAVGYAGRGRDAASHAARSRRHAPDAGIPRLRAALPLRRCRRPRRGVRQDGRQQIRSRVSCSTAT